MALSSMKLGELIEPVDIRNFDSVYTTDDVMGISVNKILINTKADLNGVNLKSYKVLEKGQFAYCLVTSRNGDKISIVFNNQKDCLISSINPVFKIKDENILDPYYLMMFFKRSEFDRFARFNSWGSARETFDWNDFCDTELKLPSIDVQKKYIAIYKAMLHNLEVYQAKLDDLKLVCDAYIEDLRRKIPCEKIEKYITRTDIRNSDNLIKNVMGVSVYKLFREPTSKVNKDELKNYKIVKPREISFVQTTHNEKVFAYAFNNLDEDIVVTSVNEVFYTDETFLLPEFLCLFFNRSEFDRYARFHSWGSARETFTWSDLIEVKIPIPDINIQTDVIKLYHSLSKRKEIVEKLKNQINNLCPIIISGAIKEGGTR